MISTRTFFSDIIIIFIKIKNDNVCGSDQNFFSGNEMTNINAGHL